MNQNSGTSRIGHEKIASTQYIEDSTNRLNSRYRTSTNLPQSAAQSSAVPYQKFDELNHFQTVQHEQVNEALTTRKLTIDVSTDFDNRNNTLKFKTITNVVGAGSDIDGDASGSEIVENES